MKRIFLVLSVIGVLSACKNKVAMKDPSAIERAQYDTAHWTTIQWMDSSVNFGTINFGEKVQVKFRFKNTGETPLILSNVIAGCGCTIPEYSKAPIAPGAEGIVTGAFDSNKSHPGPVHKTIRVTANTKYKQEYELVFSGEVRDCKNCN